ncbi:MAG TPA: alpha/beta hydrolase [Moraxellaceae bacterium]|nr:alpha/beta hydrolase [Moraxellaceae bacterium]
MTIMKTPPLSSRRWHWLAMMIIAVASAVALAIAEGSSRYAYRVVRNQVYTPSSWPQALAGDLYLPDRPGPLPVVLVVHGGSWRSGDRESVDATRIARSLAERGFVAFSVDYRLAPAYHYPAPVDDLEQAVAWLRNNASRYDLDADEVTAWGYSAGAHLVAMLGTRDNERVHLRAVVAGGVPADLTQWPNSPIVKEFLGHNAAEDAPLARDASPVSHVGPQSAPFFLYHGAWDRMVEPAQAQRFAAALSASGQKTDVYYLSGLGHLLTAVFPGAALDRGVTFLDAHVRTVSGAQPAGVVP